jgi:acetyltransferase-like isoleucine patch superfamily enzyme
LGWRPARFCRELLPAPELLDLGRTYIAFSTDLSNSLEQLERNAELARRSPGLAGVGSASFGRPSDLVDLDLAMECKKTGQSGYSPFFEQMMKTLVKWLFGIVIWAAYLAYKEQGLNALLILLPAKMIPGLLRQHGAVIGDVAEIHSPLIIHNASPEPGRHYANLRIGNECYLGRDVFLDLKDSIVIEDQVTLSMRVMLITHTDAGRSPVSARIPASHGPILLRRGAYVGAGATILQGVEVGEASVIAASALVREVVPAGSTVAGVPARIISERVSA